MTWLKSLLHDLTQPLPFALFLLSLVPLYIVLVVIHSFTLAVPFADQWDGSLPVAAAIQRGEIPWQQVWQPQNGHRHIFTYGLTILSTLTMGWNPKAEAYFTPLMTLVNWGILTWLVRQRAPQVSPWFMPLGALLLFSLYPFDLWLFSWNSAWHIAFFFCLTILAILISQPPTLKTLGLMLGLALCATFSFGTGLLVWVLLPPALWIMGYRHWWVYLLWAGMAALGIGLYFSGGTSNGQFVHLTLDTLPDFIAFLLRVLGSIFSISDYDRKGATAFGAAAVVIYAAHLGFLGWRGHSLQNLLPWLFVGGYALGSTVMIALTRFDPDQPEIALAGRYAIVATLLWTCNAALMLVAINEVLTTNPPWGKRLLQVESLLGVLMVAGTLQGNLTVLMSFSRDTNRLALYHQAGAPSAELCVRDMPIYQDPACLNDFPLNGGGSLAQVYQLAAYRLTVFSDEPPRFILPDTAHSPILVQTPSLWLNLFVQETLLNDSPQVWHLAPEPTADPLPLPSAAPGQWLQQVDDDTLAQIESLPQPTLWHIFTPQMADQAEQIRAHLLELGYFATPVPITDVRYRDSVFTIYRYDKPAADLTPLYQFAELRLAGFWLDTYQPQPCQTITVQTWWELEQPLQQQYSLTIALVQPATVIQKDGAPANVLLPFWEANRPYLDERRLTLPCDAPKGNYDVLVGVYNLGDGQDLPATLSDGSSVGNRAYLTTITVP